MLFQIVAGSTSVVTHLTRVRLRGRVDLQMLREVAVLCEAGVALITFELFDFAMNFHMAFEVARGPEGQTANLALEITLARVDRQVLGQETAFLQTNSTHFALIGFIVLQLVGCHLVSSVRSKAAFIALEISLSICSFLGSDTR